MVLYINHVRKLLLCWLVLASVYRGLRKCEVLQKFKCSIASYGANWGDWQFSSTLLSRLEMNLKQFHASVWTGGFGYSALCFLRHSGALF